MGKRCCVTAHAPLRPAASPWFRPQKPRFPRISYCYYITRNAQNNQSVAGRKGFASRNVHGYVAVKRTKSQIWAFLHETCHRFAPANRARASRKRKAAATTPRADSEYGRRVPRAEALHSSRGTCLQSDCTSKQGRTCVPVDGLSYRARSPYSMISVTTPDPTVLPPSLMANLSPSSIAIGVISAISITTLSPGMHISVPSGNCRSPVTSVVLK